jgi:hypothetical protein
MRVEMPRRNVELKASDPNPARSLQASLDIGAQDEGWLKQTDTYFRVPRGRLKLREEGDVAWLISYERADETTARESRYRLVPVSDPTGLKEALGDALGVLVVVESLGGCCSGEAHASISTRSTGWGTSSRSRRSRTPRPI